MAIRDELGQMARQLNTLTRILRRLPILPLKSGRKTDTPYNPLGDDDVLGKALLEDADLTETNRKLEKIDINGVAELMPSLFSWPTCLMKSGPR
ncbi:MAG: hypothetical protein R2727_08225 [Bacteroidales bacterium]